jgi:hypothetical protein
MRLVRIKSVSELECVRGGGGSWKRRRSARRSALNRPMESIIAKALYRTKLSVGLQTHPGPLLIHLLLFFFLRLDLLSPLQLDPYKALENCREYVSVDVQKTRLYADFKLEYQ